MCRLVFLPDYLSAAVSSASLLQTGQGLHKLVAWADAYIVTYSIVDMNSFSYALDLLERISVLRGAIRPPILLLGNKKDLEHNRQVGHMRSLISTHT